MKRAADESDARKNARMHVQKPRKQTAYAGGAPPPGPLAALIGDTASMAQSTSSTKRARVDKASALPMVAGATAPGGNASAAAGSTAAAGAAFAPGVNAQGVPGVPYGNGPFGMPGHPLAGGVAHPGTLPPNLGGPAGAPQAAGPGRKSGGRRSKNENAVNNAGGLGAAADHAGAGATGGNTAGPTGSGRFGGGAHHGPAHSGHNAKDVSMSAERKFFDHLKDVFTSIGRDAWGEFIKLIELFSGDILSKEDLYDMVGDLLTPSHQEVLFEFKQFLEAKSNFLERKEDMWISVPLSEIDFTQCRKCTPSYRALPKHYPKLKCTERSEMEATVLNDIWVSIPIGSEESYSFKHMRKNQYEEALFKCEDERFEIDMVIDSNMSTIRVLEPLAEEITQLKKLHPIGGGAGGNTNGGAGAGSGQMPRFNIQLDKRQLSTIHMNAIARIYGDHADEILELLKRNPAATIPVVLKRLKQKVISSVDALSLNV